ncbi:MAG: undecaprenyldiphospho-muramoylpentapeptide beta-N-acetylglucosaminyltransferase [Candidatus Omnitrophota bacterium]
MSDKREKKRKRIIIACGGTAGHIFPGITLAEELLKRHRDNLSISFITSENLLAKRLLEESGYDFYTLPVKGMERRSFAGNVDFIKSLFTGAVKSAGIVFREKPDCFVAFGSYVSGPPFVAASLLKVPTIIHEQNITMGRANRLMRNFATKVALSFPSNGKRKRKNMVVTGNPIRRSAAKISAREKALDFLEMDKSKFTILVTGGSQGSGRINAVLLDVFRGMDELLRRRIQVIHISGDNDYDMVRDAYEKIGGVSYGVYSFFKDMGAAYSAADATISRAGASSIFELCLHKMPSILIPYPFAGGHQADNAKYLTDRNAAIMIEEKNLSAESLKAAILRLLEDSALRYLMKRKLANLSMREAAEKLADEVETLLQK